MIVIYTIIELSMLDFIYSRNILFFFLTTFLSLWELPDREDPFPDQGPNPHPMHGSTES